MRLVRIVCKSLFDPFGQQVDETDSEEKSAGKGVAQRKEAPAGRMLGREERDKAADEANGENSRGGEQFERENRHEFMMLQ